MDKQIEIYIEGLVAEVLASPSFANLTNEQKTEIEEKLRAYINTVIFDAVIDLLNPEQLNTIKDIPLESTQMEEKLEEFSAQIPSLSAILEEKLRQKINEIKENPSTLN